MLRKWQLTGSLLIKNSCTGRRQLEKFALFHWRLGLERYDQVQVKSCHINITVIMSVIFFVWMSRLRILLGLVHGFCVLVYRYRYGTLPYMLVWVYYSPPPPHPPLFSVCQSIVINGDNRPVSQHSKYSHLHVGMQPPPLPSCLLLPPCLH